jgi:hypothetical protein
VWLACMTDRDNAPALPSSRGMEESHLRGEQPLGNTFSTSSPCRAGRSLPDRSHSAGGCANFRGPAGGDRL